MATTFGDGLGLQQAVVPWKKKKKRTPKFDNEILKFTSQLAWMQIFTTFLTLVRE